MVDGEAVIRDYMRGILEDAGHIVAEASSADEAMLLLAGDHIKMVITDIEMSSQDGLTLIADIHRKWPYLKLAVMSGRTTRPPDQLPEGTQVLCKPLSEDRLRGVAEIASR